MKYCKCKKRIKDHSIYVLLLEGMWKRRFVYTLGEKNIRQCIKFNIKSCPYCKKELPINLSVIFKQYR